MEAYGGNISVRNEVNCSSVDMEPATKRVLSSEVCVIRREERDL